ASQNAFELMQGQLPDAGRDQTIAVVDVGASMMNINVLRNGQSVYMREQPYAMAVCRTRTTPKCLLLSWTRWLWRSRGPCNSSSPQRSSIKFTIYFFPVDRQPYRVCQK